VDSGFRSRALEMTTVIPAQAGSQKRDMQPMPAPKPTAGNVI
jgi:hypothetical protein